ncbi:50S ribosomal protein L22 [Candidatus Saganbacteria bacterium]|uniref:Large ribosomal subunit protein uL22 n=1 Tax=Candidatus Saganbacteria bacterium TaxID=2575572 RepID=A0A9D6UMW4_UNCSA|nr:50S ribosomal protein L22 [Candidatus Saganbacteria bacterium]
MTKITAKAKWVRSSPRKIQRVMELVRGKPALEALMILKFLPQKGARILEKVLKSALANAKNNYKMNDSDLVIREVFVNKGIIMKRWQPRARGRAFPIKKRSSHVTVSLSAGEE